MYETQMLHTISVTTVTQSTIWRLYQLVHEITTTVSDRDVVLPFTAVVIPMITNLSPLQSILDCWVCVIKPSWSTRTTSIDGNTSLWNLIATSPCHAIPVMWHDFAWIPSITFKIALIRVAYCTVSLIKSCVVCTFTCLTCSEVEWKSTFFILTRFSNKKPVSKGAFVISELSGQTLQFPW